MKDFLLKDYELKARFLEHHFESLWKRFSLFLAIQSGLLVVLFHADRPQHLVTLFCALGIATSLLWFFFGVRDRDLVRQCRAQIDQSRREFEQVIKLGDQYSLPATYPHPGQTDPTPFSALLKALWPAFSIAAMAVWAPLLACVTWVVVRLVL